MPCGICGDFCGGYVPLCDKCEKGNKMTNELGTTLSDIEAKVDRKETVLLSLGTLFLSSCLSDDKAIFHRNIIRKYIEEN